MENKSDGVVVYSANYRHKIGFFKTWYIMIKNIVDSRELVYQLFRRDFLMQFRKSFLGKGWLLVSPLVGIISWVILNQTKILDPGDVGISFTAYVLLSSSIWGLFMGFYQAGVSTLTSGSGFIMQVKFPHEALLIKQVAQQLANFSIGFILNVVVLLIFNIVPAWQIILFPFAILPMFFLGAGIGLVISMISVVAADVSKITTTLLGIVFYITPVIYAPETRSATLQKIIEWNPLTYLIDVPRDLIIYGEVDNLDKFLFVAFLSFIFFMLSWRMFFISEDKIIERMI